MSIVGVETKYRSGLPGMDSPLGFVMEEVNKNLEL